MNLKEYAAKKDLNWLIRNVYGECKGVRLTMDLWQIQNGVSVM